MRCIVFARMQVWSGWSELRVVAVASTVVGGFANAW